MPDFKLPDGLGWPTQEPQDAERRRQEELERRIEAIRGARGRLSKLLAPLLDRKAEFRGAAVGVGCGVVRSVYQACVHQRVQCGRPEHLSAGRASGWASPAHSAWTGSCHTAA